LDYHQVVGVRFFFDVHSGVQEFASRVCVVRKLKAQIYAALRSGWFSEENPCEMKSVIGKTFAAQYVPLDGNDPLTDAEFDGLGDFLANCPSGRAMNVEQLDGFFAALIAGPEAVMPSEYYPEVFGGEMSDACEFASLDQADQILGLMTRHWNTIARTLFKGEVYVPLLLEDENGMDHGNDWAQGFVLGMHMRHDVWAELVNDDEHGGFLVPMMMLCHEHDEDPEMRPEPISRAKREEIIVHMTAGLLGAYQYFREHRQASPTAHTGEPEHTASKVGRNELCPCGSGKKYKWCCGGATVN
jgi:uncharacterized protein